MFANPKTKRRQEIKQETMLTKTYFLERPPEVVQQYISFLSISKSRGKRTGKLNNTKKYKFLIQNSTSAF